MYINCYVLFHVGQRLSNPSNGLSTTSTFLTENTQTCQRVDSISLRLTPKENGDHYIPTDSLLTPTSTAEEHTAMIREESKMWLTGHMKYVTIPVITTNFKINIHASSDSPRLAKEKAVVLIRVPAGNRWCR